MSRLFERSNPETLLSTGATIVAVEDLEAEPRFERPSRLGRMLERLGVLREYDLGRLTTPSHSFGVIYDPDYKEPLMLKRILVKNNLVKESPRNNSNSVPSWADDITPHKPTKEQLEDHAIVMAAFRATDLGPQELRSTYF